MVEKFLIIKGKVEKIDELLAQHNAKNSEVTLKEIRQISKEIIEEL